MTPAASATPSSSSPSRPTISVVICSRNRPDFLLAAVRSVLAGDQVPSEIIVIDQSDAPADAISELDGERGCRVHYVPTASRGVSRARNLGLETATGDVVAFTDDDVFVDRGWLGAIADALATADPRDVVTGRVLATEAEAPGGFAPALVASEQPATYEGRVARDVLEAGNMAVRRSTLAALLGFDPRLGPGTDFPAGEDNDMGYRLLAAGCCIRYVPAALIYHRAWRGPDEMWPLRWRYGIGQGAYYAKHLSRRDRYMLRRLGRLVGHHLGLAVRRARKAPRGAIGHLVYVAGVVVGGTQWLTRYRGSPEHKHVAHAAQEAPGAARDPM
jgi:GT2 family glycosyltransferase